MPRYRSHEEGDIDPDALTTDPDIRIRQMNLVLYTARCAAEKAGEVYRAAVKRMHAAEINFHRAVNQKRQRSISGSTRAAP